MKWQLPETYRQVLAALARRAPPKLDDIDADTLADLRKWGMVMSRSLELTGMGQGYAAAEEQKLL